MGYPSPEVPTHAMLLFEQNGNMEQSNKDTTTLLDSMTIYPINPVIFIL